MNFLWREAFGEKAAAGYLRGDDDSVGLFVDELLAGHLADFFEGVVLLPAEILFAQEAVLKLAVGGASIADKFAAALLDFFACGKRCSGERDQSVAGRDAAVRPAIEERRVAMGQEGVEGWSEQILLAEKNLNGVDPGKGIDEVAGNAFAFEAAPGEGGVDAIEMTAAVEFSGEFEVVEDSEAGLNDLHQ